MAWFSTQALGYTVQTPYPVPPLLPHKKPKKQKKMYGTLYELQQLISS